MAAYTNDLRLKEITTGDESGTWGDSTNTNLELIAEAFSFGTEAITTNADTHATTIADGSTDEGRSIYLKYTGTLDSACTITLGPNTVSKLWFIENATSGSQNIIISQGSGANVTIPPGDVKAVYSDGAGSGAAIVDAFASLNVVDLKVEDDLTVTDDATVGGTLGVTGVLTADAGIDIDNINIDGTTIALSSGDLTLDVAGDIILDVDGDNVFFKDGSSNFFSVSNVSGDAYLGVEQSDKDLLIRGNDGGTAFTALTFDMSAAGAATFNSNVTLGSVGSGSSTATPIELNLGSTFADGVGNAKTKLKLFEDSSANVYGFGVSNNLLEYHAAASGNHSFYINDSEKMRIDSSGNVLVGTTTFNNLSTESGVLASNNVVMARGGLSDHQDACAVLQYASDTTWLRAYGDTAGSGFIVFRTGGGAGSTDTERMRIADNGRVGIGTTTTNAGLTVANADIRCTGAAVLNDANSISMSQESGSVGAITCRGPSTSERASMVLTVSRSNGGSGISAIRIENDGKTIVGTDNATSAVGILEVRDDGSAPIFLVHKNSTGATDGMRVRHGRGLSGFAGTGISFRRNDDTEVGKVSIGFTNVTYDTTSDYRLKENVNYSWDATTRIKQLKPARFNFKEETGITLDGFLAHEVQEVVPQAVTGEKDGEQMQGIDHSKLVPLLVKTIQELEARITALES